MPKGKVRIPDIPEELHRKIKSEASLAGKTLSKWIEDTLNSAVNAHYYVGIDIGKQAAFTVKDFKMFHSGEPK